MPNVSQQILEELKDTIKTFLDEGVMFTGYDVTIATRERMRIKLRHQEVQEQIHTFAVLTDAVDFGYTDPSGNTVEWDESKQPMPGIDGSWAIVYHPVNLDPNSFVPRGANKPQSQQAQTTPVVQQDDDEFTTDKRYRLFVPTRFIKEAGMNAGDTVYVVPDMATNTIVLSKNSQLGTIVTTQIVERNGDLRLSSRTLKSGGLADNQKFTIENADWGGNSIVQIGASG